MPTESLLIILTSGLVIIFTIMNVRTRKASKPTKKPDQPTKKEVTLQDVQRMKNYPPYFAYMILDNPNVTEFTTEMMEEYREKIKYLK